MKDLFPGILIQNRSFTAGGSASDIEIGIKRAS
jgi:hypothetical protein